MIGVGTLVNALTVLIGATIGLLVGQRLPERTRQVVTDGLGLVTLLIAASSAVEVFSPDLADAVGDSAPMLIVLGALLTGGIIGSLLRIEDRLEGLGDRLQGVAARRRARTPYAGLADQTTGRTTDGSADGSSDESSDGDARSGGPAGRPGGANAGRSLFIEGFVTSSLVFCVGPLTILGSITEGIGGGPDQLLLKAALDGFASIAFAAAFGWGVFASIPTILVVQGGLTALGVLLGDFLPDAHVAALTATGGLLLVAVAIRLLHLRQVKVGDLLPALVTAPLITALVVWIR